MVSAEKTGQSSCLVIVWYGKWPLFCSWAEAQAQTWVFIPVVLERTPHQTSLCPGPALPGEQCRGHP